MWYEVPEDSNAFRPVVNGVPERHHYDVRINESQYKKMDKEVCSPYISPKNMAAKIKHDVEEDLLKVEKEIAKNKW